MIPEFSDITASARNTRDQASSEGGLTLTLFATCSLAARSCWISHTGPRESLSSTCLSVYVCGKESLSFHMLMLTDIVKYQAKWVKLTVKWHLTEALESCSCTLDVQAMQTQPLPSLAGAFATNMTGIRPGRKCFALRLIWLPKLWEAALWTLRPPAGRDHSSVLCW